MNQLPEGNNNSALARPEQLIAAVLHLMSHYVTQRVLHPERRAGVQLAAVIERHLQILAQLPDLTPVLRATCEQLADQWLTVIEQALPATEKTGLAARWRHFSPLS